MQTKVCGKISVKYNYITSDPMNHSTLKQGCQAGIKLKLSVDGQSLVLTDLSEDHNHEVDKVSIDTFFRTLNRY